MSLYPRKLIFPGDSKLSAAAMNEERDFARRGRYNVSMAGEGFRSMAGIINQVDTNDNVRFSFFRLTGGPDVDALYTAIEVRLTEPFVYEDVDDTEHTLVFANDVEQPEAADGKTANGWIVLAFDTELLEDSTELWLVSSIMAGTADDTADVVASSFTESARDTTIWDRTAQDTKDGVIVTMQTRTQYDTSDSTLYGFTRNLVFDSQGALTFITEETKELVTIAVDCSPTTTEAQSQTWMEL